MRLDKYLSDMNEGTRKEIKEAVRRGNVSVNGAPAKDPGMHVSAEDTITISGRRVVREDKVYIMLNKPAGVITAVSDLRERTVMDLLGEMKRKDVFPVGRLDKDTTGLLLITNDGAFDHALMSPKHHVDKTYRVLVNGRLGEDDVSAMASGLEVDDTLTAAPAKLEIVSSGETSEAVLTIHEGKYHQVKRMFAALGKEVVMLRREAVGGLKLDPGLREGEWRRLEESEVEMLR